MTALEPGNKAPDIELPLLGGGMFSLADSLSKGRVLLVFFKISCPVCQFALPFTERLAKRGRGLKIIGISQDDAKGTEIFRKTFGLSYPIALDHLGSYPVSNAYGLTNVPTMFLVGEDGNVEQTVVSWSKAEIEEIDKLHRDSPDAPFFLPSEQVAEFRAG